MRALKGLVIGMGVLIVVGLTIVVVTIAMRLGSGEDGAPAAAPAEGPAPAAPEWAGFGRLSLGVADSCTIADAVDSGGRLIVRLAGPKKDGCDQLVVVDPARGQVLGRIAPGEVRASAGADSGGAE